MARLLSRSERLEQSHERWRERRDSAFNGFLEKVGWVYADRATAAKDIARAITILSPGGVIEAISEQPGNFGSVAAGGELHVGALLRGLAELAEAERGLRRAQMALSGRPPTGLELDQ